jgi:hypothetical protein
LPWRAELVGGYDAVMDDTQLRSQAQYRLKTRTVNTIGENIYFHGGDYWWPTLLWGAALAVVLICQQPYLILFTVGFYAGWLFHHFRSLSGLAHQNEILDYFVDWPKVHAVASGTAVPPAESA